MTMNHYYSLWFAFFVGIPACLGEFPMEDSCPGAAVSTAAACSHVTQQARGMVQVSVDQAIGKAVADEMADLEVDEMVGSENGDLADGPGAKDSEKIQVPSQAREMVQVRVEEGTGVGRKQAGGPLGTKVVKNMPETLDLMRSFQTTGSCGHGGDVDLMRVGPRVDGGYVICKNAAVNSTAMISIGIRGMDPVSTGISEQFGVRAEQYDCTSKPSLCPSESTRCNVHFNHVCAAGEKSMSEKGEFDTLESMVRKLDAPVLHGGNPAKHISHILKIDCEGCEWETLAAVPGETLQQFRMIIGEFHWLAKQEKHSEYLSVMKKLLQTHRLVHTHACNCLEPAFLQVDGTEYRMPDIVEFLAVRKDLSVEAHYEGNKYLSLDAPVCPKRQEIKEGHWSLPSLSLLQKKEGQRNASHLQENESADGPKSFDISRKSNMLQVTSGAALAAFHQNLMEQQASGLGKILLNGPNKFASGDADAVRTVHMCAVATKAVLPEFQFLMRSVKKAMSNSRSKAKFHILTDIDSVPSLRNELKTLDFAGEAQILDFNRLEVWADHAKIQTKHHSGLAGFTKLFFFELFKGVKQCILIDADAYVVEDPSQLLATFDTTKMLLGTWRPYNPFGTKINTGVLVENFELMNKKGPAGITFSDALLQSHALANKAHLTGASEEVYIPAWGDQSILHLGLLAYAGEVSLVGKPGNLQTMDSSWNLEMCMNFEGLCSGEPSKALKIGHFNCGFEEGQQWWKEAKFSKFSSCMQRNGVDLSLLPGKE